MNKLTAGSIPLFRVAGIQVYLHWSWLLIAYLEVVRPVNEYRLLTWNIIEYVSLFGIVLLHEFGHSLACRQVGGKADRIVLWPLGGVAFVQPPPRPGAVLWSIAAGPLVNLVLVPITAGAFLLARNAGLGQVYPDVLHFLYSIAVINFGLLVFNMLPVYPLDGGQILQALLWFVIGRARSLMVSGVIGLVTGAAVLGLALIRFQNTWLAVVAGFVAWRAWEGFRSGVLLQQLQPTLDLLEQAVAAQRAGKYDEAADIFTKVIDAGGRPDILGLALMNLGVVETLRGNWQRAIENYRAAIKLQPKLVNAHNNLAWTLAVCPVDALRNGKEAVEHATWACKATQWSNSTCLGTLAAACAEAGNFQEAVRLQKQANSDPAYCKTHGEQAAVGRLRLYEQGLPFRMTGQGGAAGSA
jgi:Zn-dependent protease